MDTARNGRSWFYTTGLGFRNDTLFIEMASIANVVGVRREKDTGFSYVLLRPIREKKKPIEKRTFIFNPITEHSKLPDSTEKNSNKKKVPAKKS